MNLMHLSILLSLLGLSWYGTLGGQNSESDKACSIRDTNLRLQFLGGYDDPTDSSDECYEYRIHSHCKSGGSDDDTTECEFDVTRENRQQQSLQWSLQICDGTYCKSVIAVAPQMI